MDAPEAELDIKLQKISGDLIAEFDRFLPRFLRKTDSDGRRSRVRSRLRARELNWATSHVRVPLINLLYTIHYLDDNPEQIRTSSRLTLRSVS